jgi:hypothetical protein
LTSIYRITSSGLIPLARKSLAREEMLEDWIAANPRLIGLDVLVLGRQIVTDHNGRIDILAMDIDGGLVVIELKRDRTPRDIVAQVLDYASWVRRLTTKRVHRLAMEKLKRPLADAFRETFECSLPETLNTSHSLVIVASEFDASSKRIVEYLAEEHDVAINTAFFSVFEQGEEQLLATDWLLDQEAVVERATTQNKAPWTGFYYANVGQGEHRTWEDMMRYGFISAGQGPRWRNAIKRLKVGDRFFAYAKSCGYVGFGEVTADAVMARDFIVGEKSILECELKVENMADNRDDPENAEYVAGVKWLKTYPLDQAKTFSGIFASTHVVCKLSDTATLEFLRDQFGVETLKSVSS